MKNIALANISLLAILSIALEPASAARSDVVKELERLAGSGSGLGLSVELESPVTVVGKPIDVTLSVARTAHVRLVLVDAHGVVDVADPRFEFGNRLSADTPVVLPADPATPGILVARMPDGAADLFVLATERPLPAPADEQSDSNDVWRFSASAAGEKARDWVDAVTSGGFGQAEVRHLTLSITPQGEYTPAQIVNYYAEQTRSIERPKLDVYLNFEFGTTEITPDSLPRLDIWSRVLQNPALASQTFQIGGHTDDVGSDDYNYELSARRAQRVKELLVARGVAANRLVVRGFGKDVPLNDGSSEEERARNRRVEFERVTSFDQPSR